MKSILTHTEKYLNALFSLFSFLRSLIRIFETKKKQNKKMTQNQFIGAIDQGTTSTRFVIFDQEGKLITWHQMEFEQHYTHPGYIAYFYRST